ncbi:LysR family transcriptional regulator [Pseudomonas taiwanensis]|uniref:LysR family transcriptional regulator n=1 Tax=Pseudomonas taiwanensis TaxID=470150 RepID=A0ABR6V467_9PSED|nr:LysR family transcriptional regulator [Pseudomonas taiwanensis]MBC3475010.1 LysR family transcriptional regulator [Pseudomonas taiwanensis]
MDEFKSISTFILAAELLSFRAAAEAQSSTPQAVSKAVQQLERTLGVRLFHRTTRKISLTDEGARLLKSAKPNLDGLRNALAQARNAVSDVEGLIRLSAAGAVGRRVLMPLIMEFQARHPLVHFDLIVDDGFTDLVAERIDVGFRAGNQPDAQVVARRLFDIQLIVCATSEYLRAYGAPRNLIDLSNHRCSGYRQRGNGRAMAWEFKTAGGEKFVDVSPVLTSSDSETEMHAVLSGKVLGQIDSINAAAALRAGELIPVMLNTLSERMGLYIYYAQRADMPARIRTFIDFAIEKLLESKEFCLPQQELKHLASRI